MFKMPRQFSEFLNFVTSQANLKKTVNTLIITFVVLLLLYLFYRLYRRILRKQGKDRFTIYDSYNEKCEDFAGVSDDSDIFIFKKKNNFGDIVVPAAVVVILGLIFLNIFGVVVLFIVDYFKENFNFFIYFPLTFLTAVIMLLLYVLIIYLIIKAVSAIRSFIGRKYFGRSTHSSARIRKAGKDR